MQFTRRLSTVAYLNGRSVLTTFFMVQARDRPNRSRAFLRHATVSFRVRQPPGQHTAAKVVKFNGDMLRQHRMMNEQGQDPASLGTSIHAHFGKWTEKQNGIPIVWCYSCTLRQWLDRLEGWNCCYLGTAWHCLRNFFTHPISQIRFFSFVELRGITERPSCGNSSFPWQTEIWRSYWRVGTRLGGWFGEAVDGWYSGSIGGGSANDWESYRVGGLFSFWLSGP